MCSITQYLTKFYISIIVPIIFFSNNSEFDRLATKNLFFYKLFLFTALNAKQVFFYK